MDFANFLIQLLNGVQYGLLLFMLAAGLTLIFGIMGVVNLAHGSFYMLGAYMAWFFTAQFDSLVLAILLGTVLAVVFGWLLEWGLFRFFYHRDHLDQVLLTFGLIYIFEEVRSILWGDDVHAVQVPEALLQRFREHGRCLRVEVPDDERIRMLLQDYAFFADEPERFCCLLESLVELRGLTFGYGERVILDDISLTVPRGKVTALMGASGGGWQGAGPGQESMDGL